MATLANVTFAAGEDVVDTLSVYAADGVTTVDTTGWTMSLYATEPGGKTVLTLASPGNITVAAPLAYQASVTFTSAGTSSIAPGYYNLSVWRTNSAADAEVVAGTLMLTAAKPA